MNLRSSAYLMTAALASMAPGVGPAPARHNNEGAAPSNPRPSESSLPPSRLAEKRPAEKTPDDLARIEAAEAKRRRKAGRK